ncbi:MAG: BolA/IbaG family iron-sulfur metabolism protein [Proteobacteria bacterium]|nr:BolA/IbaG family iron-sulfur metabolism protein [Pseudomonadota bacterium]MCH8097289.1 BolA/IbaG family iron-sulfur metabolism protein [Pseudomonadota bacterium]
MSMRQNIETKIVAELSPEHLEVIDESHMHSVPPGAESHFKLIIVSGMFAGEPLIRRHQRVNSILAAELNGGLHALSLRTLTAEEWQKKGGETVASPPCLGGGKADKET